MGRRAAGVGAAAAGVARPAAPRRYARIDGVSEADAPVEVPEAPPPAEPAPLSQSDAALRTYRHRLRRQRLLYFGIIGVVLVVIGVLVGIAWENGEVANTTLHTVPRAPLPLEVSSASLHQTEAWHTGDRIAIGTPRWRGTVVTYDAHTVRGRDARTGAQTWYYSRSDRTVCTAMQTQSTTIAVYDNHGNCDEVTALSSDTGDRRWTRTLDKDGLPIDGQPAYQVSDTTILISTSSVIYAIDPVTGYDRWEYHRTGCVIEHVVQGTTGVLISQDCHHVDCPAVPGAHRFCGNGPQLFLRDGIAGTDSNEKDNPDQLHWDRLGDTDIPASADDLVAALNTTTHQLDMLEQTTGAARGSLTLDPAPATIDGPVPLYTLSTEVIWVGGVSYAINSTSRTLTWAAREPSPPTIESATEGVLPSIDTARITAPGAPGVRIVDGNTGNTAQQFALPVPARGTTVYSLGAGFLVSSAAGTVAYN